MADKSDGSPSGRDRLLAAVIDHYATDGLGEQSLRQIATAVGSSHRMLLYHFGSKDGLLLAVAQGVEARTKARLTAMITVRGPSSSETTDQNIVDMWEMVADPTQANFERLFFALYNRALQGDEAIRPMLVGDIDGWIAVNVQLSAGQGIPDDVARAHTRLGIAVTRGLLLDLLATGDRAGVDAALHAFAAHYVGRWWESLTIESPRAS
jgi:AcrR family transcriptional regulator